MDERERSSVAASGIAVGSIVLALIAAVADSTGIMILAAIFALKAAGLKLFFGRRPVTE